MVANSAPKEYLDLGIPDGEAEKRSTHRVHNIRKPDGYLDNGARVVIAKPDSGQLSGVIRGHVSDNDGNLFYLVQIYGTRFVHLAPTEVETTVG